MLLRMATLCSSSSISKNNIDKENIKENWDELFKNLNIKVKSNIEIFEKGNLNGGLYHE